MRGWVVLYLLKYWALFTLIVSSTLNNTTTPGHNQDQEDHENQKSGRAMTPKYERRARIVHNPVSLYADSMECGIIWRIWWESNVGEGRDRKFDLKFRRQYDVYKCLRFWGGYLPLHENLITMGEGIGI
jgi:hypothetical protein